MIFRYAELIFVQVFTLLLVLAPITYVMLNSGVMTVNIEKSFENELVMCEQTNEELEELLEKEKPNCPSVTCSEGASGIIWGVLGILFYAGGLFFFLRQEKQKKLLEEELANMKKKKK